MVRVIAARVGIPERKRISQLLPCVPNLHADGGCPTQATCTNTVGSFTCQCNIGFGGAECANIDECLDSNVHQCHVDASCTDTQGSFSCACNEG